MELQVKQQAETIQKKQDEIEHLQKKLQVCEVRLHVYI